MVDFGTSAGSGDYSGKGPGDKGYDPGSMGGGGSAADDIDDEHVTPAITCRAKGWYWYDSACHEHPRGEETPAEEEEKEEGGEEGGGGADFEKGSKYEHKPLTPKTGTPGSETERAKKLEDTGKSIADSVRSHLSGEVAGVGRKSAELAEVRDTKKENEERLALLQAQAARGMSFSTPHFDAEVDLIDKWVDTGLMREDTAAQLQYQLDLQALRAMEPIEALLASGEIGSAGMEGTFEPGAFASGDYMDTGFGLGPAPTFSGLPKKGTPLAEDTADTGTTGDTSHFTDGKGNTCYMSETSVDDDGVRTCPGTTVGGGEGPDGDTGW